MFPGPGALVPRGDAMPNDPSSQTKRVRAALYARVSTTDRTAENQLRALREHAERAGWTIVGEFIDHAVSGTRERRPGLDRLMADARRRRFDLIAVAALDRLGRNRRRPSALRAAIACRLPSDWCVPLREGGAGVFGRDRLHGSWGAGSAPCVMPRTAGAR